MKNSDFRVEKVFRFGVGYPDGPRSGIWRVWANAKGDFYFSARVLGGILKTSLHRDSRCHTGFTSEYFKNPDTLSPKNRSRHLDQWVLPSNPAVAAAEILIPETELRIFPIKSPNKIIWLTPPDKNHLVGVLFVVATKGIDVDWNSFKYNLEPLGVIDTNTKSLFIVFRKGPMTQEHQYQINKELCRAKKKISEEKQIGRRLILLGQKGNRPRQFIEFAWQDKEAS